MKSVLYFHPFSFFLNCDFNVSVQHLNVDSFEDDYGSLEESMTLLWQFIHCGTWHLSSVRWSSLSDGFVCGRSLLPCSDGSTRFNLPSWAVPVSYCNQLSKDRLKFWGISTCPSNTNLGCALMNTAVAIIGGIKKPWPSFWSAVSLLLQIDILAVCLHCLPSVLTVRTFSRHQSMALICPSLLQLMQGKAFR